MLLFLALTLSGLGGKALIATGHDVPVAVAKKNDKGDHGKHKGQKKHENKDDDNGNRTEFAPVEPRGTVVTAPPVSPTPENATGLVLVTSVRCNAGTPAAGMEWNDRCVEPDRGASFRLGAEEGLFAGWFTEHDGDETGTARFEAVPAGRYSLEEVGRNWCHAESDSVDTNGDVVVRSDGTVQVWIYNCLYGGS